MTVPTLTQAADVVERIRQMLASVGVTVNRALIGRIVSEVQAAPTAPSPAADSVATMSQYTDRPTVGAMTPEIAAQIEGGQRPVPLVPDRVVRAFVEALLDPANQDAWEQDADATLQNRPSELSEEQIQGIVAGAAGNLASAGFLVGQTAGTVVNSTYQEWTATSKILAPWFEGKRFPNPGRSARAAWRQAAGIVESTIGTPDAPAVGAIGAAETGAEATPAAASTAESGRVWVVGPNGQPMLASLAAGYVSPLVASLIPTDEEIAARAETMLASGQYDDPALATAQARMDLTTERVNAQEAAQQTAGPNTLVGVSPGYWTVRSMPGYQTQQWAQSGEMIGGGAPSGQEVDVVLEAQLTQALISEYYLLPPEDLADLQETMERAGLLDPGSYSSNPLDTEPAFVNLLTVGNRRGDPNYWDTLDWLISTAESERPTFTPSPYQAPDYDTLAETVYEIFARDLGRDPEEWEARQLAQSFGDYYYQQYQSQVELERQQFMAENEIPTEQAISQPGQTVGVGGVPVGGMPPAWQEAIDAERGYSEGQPFRVPAQEDPYSSFMQYFRQQYRPETDMRRQVINNAYGRDNLFNSIGRMDTLARGGA